MGEPGQRVVAITGGAGGLGQAFAARFARDGQLVVLLDRDAGALEQVAARLRGDGHAVEAVVLDVTDAGACARVLGDVVERHGGLDVLVNNAGISHHSLFRGTNVEVVRRVLEVNFLGAVHCTKAALPGLVRRKGMVVAISSVAGFAPLVGRCAYAASKHALHGFFDTLRVELEQDGVGVLLVCPSYVDTPIDHRALSGDGGQAVPGKTVVGRLLAPEAVADAVARGVARRADQLMLSPVARASWWLSRLAPGLYARIMRSTHRDELA